MEVNSVRFWRPALLSQCPPDVLRLKSIKLNSTVISQSHMAKKSEECFAVLCDIDIAIPSTTSTSQHTILCRVPPPQSPCAQSQEQIGITFRDEGGDCANH